MIIRLLALAILVAALFAGGCCSLGACDTLATDQATQLNIPNS